MKTIKLSALVFEMLNSLAKTQRKTPEVLLEETIKIYIQVKNNERTRTSSTYKEETNF